MSKKKSGVDALVECAHGAIFQQEGNIYITRMYQRSKYFPIEFNCIRRYDPEVIVVEYWPKTDRAFLYCYTGYINGWHFSHHNMGGDLCADDIGTFLTADQYQIITKLLEKERKQFSEHSPKA